MIRVSELGGLYQSVPKNLKDIRTKAFMYACERQIKKLLEYAEKTKVWCAIDKVEEIYLDYIAADCRTLFYSSSLEPDIKRSLISHAQFWYMKLGTSTAMKEMTDIVFKNNDTFVEEWFEYGGKAYFFRITINIGSTGLTEEKIYELVKEIQVCKNARSLLEKIRYNLNAEKAVVHVNAVSVYGEKLKVKALLADKISSSPKENIKAYHRNKQIITVKRKRG